MKAHTSQWVALLAVLSVLLLLTVPLSFAVTLAWDANPEPDLGGYKLHYGYAPGDYNTTIDVGNVTQYEVTGLALGQGYYFSATAYFADDPVGSNSECLGLDDPYDCCIDVGVGNCDYAESDYSNEVFYYNAIPGGLVGSLIAHVIEVCGDPPATIGNAHGDGYEIQILPDG